MSAPFTRSMRSVAEERSVGLLLQLSLAAVILALWLYWFFAARIAVYEQSVSARVEVDQLAHRVDVVVGGQVVDSFLTLGRTVAKGEILVSLDDRALQLDLAEQRARHKASLAQLDPLRLQITAQERALREQRRVAQAQLEETRSHARSAEALAQIDGNEAARAANLLREHFVSQSDWDRANAVAIAKRGLADEARIQIERITAQLAARESEIEGALAGLKREAATLEGTSATLAASIASTEHRIALMKIRAPVAGRIGEIVALHPGAVLRAGDKIASVVPVSGLRMIAEFPITTVGRVRIGLQARVRLDSFPWAQHGSLAASVTSVASERQDDKFRVELAVGTARNTSIRLEHGLSGVVEVEVEQVSPAVLVLRAAGRLVRGPEGINR